MSLVNPVSVNPVLNPISNPILGDRNMDHSGGIRSLRYADQGQLPSRTKCIRGRTYTQDRVCSRPSYRTLTQDEGFISSGQTSRSRVGCIRGLWNSTTCWPVGLYNMLAPRGQPLSECLLPLFKSRSTPGWACAVFFTTSPEEGRLGLSGQICP